MTNCEQIFAELWPTENGKQIGHIQLNAPKALNSLNLPMAQAMRELLKEWQQNEQVAAVFIDGSGEKAFCAGGDVVAMHNAMKENEGDIPQFLEEFFVTEYKLDYLIHTYSKPIVLWGNGIVMGGGIGLMAGASHRVVTETARIAMPEITIGLYPDVGGSYFLNNMPTGCGLFLGLTGASINATDALTVNLADHLIAAANKDDVITTLKNIDWSEDSEVNHDLVTEQLSQQELSETPASHIEPYLSQISALENFTSAAEVAQAILAIEGEDKWLSRAQNSLRHGSAITAHLVLQQLKRGKQQSLADTFRMEAVMSVRCGEFGEFQEGVRALLIDKDNQPNWRYKQISDVPSDVVETFFHSPWDNHPLANLEQE